MTVTAQQDRRTADEGRETALAALQRRFGERFTLNRTIREQHANTLTWQGNQPPDAVVYPETTAEVVEIVRLCAAHKVPMIPYGTGTSLEGHVNAPSGGVCIDTSRMKQIIAVNAEDLDCVVEPGVTRKELNEYLRDSGLFFPIDPGADASIGGMTATRASGTNAVRYGTMRENVLAVEAVLPDGRVIHTGSRARKSSAGYDLTRLFVGSEGTLGVITKITLRLHGVPEAISAGCCPFPTVHAACDATIQTIQSGIPVARIELLDVASVRSVNAYSKIGLPETPLLLLEFHGSGASVKEQAERFGEIAEALGGGPFRWATSPEERTRLWQARHDAYWAARAANPGMLTFATDACVPISRLADCVAETMQDLERIGIPGGAVGHVGDGNFHVQPFFDVNDPAQRAAIEGFLERLAARAIAMGGTCTGEHGVGQGKMKFMAAEHGEDALDVMRAIKTAIDPDNLMNPGKILPPRAA
ncbi:FAD-binding oxidoreductase [Camelimonas abortus]|uniref:D-lactate dehydrogenase (cytochrome) n=1 Tax=Camelimonas abortus TaxID=1017184 RepID=A0ABV7LHQ5_9HYPH